MRKYDLPSKTPAVSREHLRNPTTAISKVTSCVYIKILPTEEETVFLSWKNGIQAMICNMLVEDLSREDEANEIQSYSSD